MRYILFLLSLMSFKGFAQFGYRASTKDAPATRAYDGSYDFAELDASTDKASLIGEQLYFAIPNDGTTPPPFTTMTVEEPTSLYSILATEHKTQLEDPFYGPGWTIHGAGIRNRRNQGDYRSYISFLYKPAVTIFSPESRNLWVGTPYAALQDKFFTIKDCRDSIIPGSGRCYISFALQDANGKIFSWGVHQTKVHEFNMVHIRRHLTQQHNDFVGKKFYVRCDTPVPAYSFNILDSKYYENVVEKAYTCTNMNFVNSQLSGIADPFLIFEDDSGYEIAVCPPGHELGKGWGSTGYYLNEKEYATFKLWRKAQLDSIAAAGAALGQQQKKGKKQATTNIAVLEKEYGKDTAHFILSGRVQLGMTKKMCLQSWGKPLSFVENQHKGKKIETLRYGVHKWLRFTNGKLTSFSDIR